MYGEMGFNNNVKKRYLKIILSVITTPVLDSCSRGMKNGLSLLESIKSSTCTTTILIYTFKLLKYICGNKYTCISTRVIRNFVKNDGICLWFLSWKQTFNCDPKRGQWHHLRTPPGGIFSHNWQLSGSGRHSDSNLPYFTFEPQQFQPKWSLS